MFLDFKIKDYLPEFHEDILVQVGAGLLDYLYDHRPLRNLNKNEMIISLKRVGQYGVK